MSQTLVAGGNAALENPYIIVHIKSGVEIDAVAYRLSANGKVRGDQDMIFYGQTASPDGTVTRVGNDRHCQFDVQLAQQSSDVERIAFAISGQVKMADLGSLSIAVEFNGAIQLQCPVTLAGRTETALILGECYRRNGQWKFRFIAQGFNGGLQPLSEHFGVEIADTPSAPPTPPTPQPTPAPTISLSKITLTKANASISLAKKEDLKEIKINLNWNQGKQNRGLFGGLFGGNGNIDLDLGAFVRLKNGYRDVIQALGNSFGELNHKPYVALRGDDRSGAVAEGEWLDVNGKHWNEIDEILIYAFIYEGVPNWDATDGVVTLFVEKQEIETRLTDGNARHGMCAIARLVNENGGVRVERINRYFSGHKEMDEAFGWGFRWKAGSK